MSRFIQRLPVMFILLLPIFTSAQEWVARYNGPGNGSDAAKAIAVDSTGNIYVTGGSTGSGMFGDYATIKYDASGVEQWVARYSGLGNANDEATAITVDDMGNIYVTGTSYGSGTSFDYATVKYDPFGVEQWVARYNGPADGGEHATAIAVDNAGNVYVTGFSEGSGTSDDYATVKYDTSGVEQWVARYDGPVNDYDGAYGVAADTVGNIYVTGVSIGSGTFGDYVTIKYDASGVEQWVARYNGPDDGGDGPTAIAIDNGGNIFVTGGSVGSGSSSDYATVKYDTSGVEQWVARYNGIANRQDVASAIALDNAGNIYVTGQSYDSSTYYDYATVKYDASGMEQWVTRYNGPVNGYDEANAIAVDNTGNVYVTGGSLGSGGYSDYATVKYDASGVEQWAVRYDGPDSLWDVATAIAVDNTNGVYVTGGSGGLNTGIDYATIRYSTTGVEEQSSISVRNSYLGATILRGPLQLPEGKTCIVFDIAGRVVEPTNIRPGIYFLEIDGKITQKVVMIR